MQDSPAGEALISIKRKSDRFIVKSLNPESPELWTAIKFSGGNEGQVLKEGDEIKLGRVRLKVSKISRGFEENLTPIKDSLHIEDYSEREKDATCRICCCEEENVQDPLITPCKCTGSVRYIHLSCIKKWLESKVNCRSTTKVVSYNWSDLSCEICKTELPHSVRHNGKVLELVSIKFPNGPHLVLEETKEEGQQTLFLVDLQGNQAVIGRGHDCDLRLADISVSRKHAKFLWQNGYCILKDSSSKFGTLISSRTELILERDRTIGVQLGRSLIKLRCKVQSTCWVYCCESDSPKAISRNPHETDPQSPISFRIN